MSVRDPVPDARMFEAAFDEAPIGIALVDLDGRIVRANEALGDLLGRPVGELTGHTVHSFGHPADEHIRLADRAAILAGTVPRSSFVKRYLRADGSPVWLAVSTSRIGCPDGPVLLSHFADVTGEQQAASRLGHAAAHDALTGLANRAHLMEQLTAALRGAGGPDGGAPETRQSQSGLPDSGLPDSGLPDSGLPESGLPDDGLPEDGLPESGARPAGDVTLLFIDLDQFKIVNDSLGHETGDRVLRAVGRRLAGEPGLGEVARFGGDEFVVLRTGLPAAEVAGLCNRLLAVLSEPVEVDGRLLGVGASIGVARAERGASAASLLRDADAAMYAAKRAGRGRFVVSDASVRGSAMAALTEEGDLRDALTRGALALHAQPIRDLRTLRVVAVEALARWRHPDRGELSPELFANSASRAGLSRALGRWALDEACRRRASWAERAGNPDLRFSVNIDAEHLVHPSLVDDVRGALAAHGVAPGSLTIEITERSLVDAFPAIVARLTELVTDGVRLSLDDFGTGWSSLAYLRLLPVSSLKVDRVFVHGAAHSPRDAVILDGIAGIGRGLGLVVVAEGIETVADLAAARAAGCTLGQGFLLGRPSASGEPWDAVPAGLGVPEPVPTA